MGDQGTGPAISREAWVLLVEPLYRSLQSPSCANMHYISLGQRCSQRNSPDPPERRAFRETLGTLFGNCCPMTMTRSVGKGRTDSGPQERPGSCQEQTGSGSQVKGKGHIKEDRGSAARFL